MSLPPSPMPGTPMISIAIESEYRDAFARYLIFYCGKNFRYRPALVVAMVVWLKHR